MTNGMRKLITIVTESGLERELVGQLEAAGVSGYTITDARGRGRRGRRSGGWEYDTNIRIEVLCDTARAARIVERIRAQYYDDYAMVTWMQDVNVFRPEKFT